MAADVSGGVSSVARKHPLSFVAVSLAVVTALSAAPVIHLLRSSQEARTAAQNALADRDRAMKDAAELKDRLDQAEVARQAAEEERDQATTAEQAAKRAEHDDVLVLAFLRDKLLSAGRPPVWTDPPKKDITLREAADEAEPQVAEAFPDRPLAEASVRSALGWTYFYLGEADRAIKQYERALSLGEAEVGPDDPLTVGYRNDLARAYRMAGRADDASRLYDQNVSPASRTSSD
jgi:tetratricopeptide (TPR) repeat protein